MKTLSRNLIVAGMALMVASPAFAENPGAIQANPGAQSGAGMQKGISEIQHLAELLRDGQEGYRLSAEDAENAQLKQLFSQYSEQRAKFLADLQAEVARLGGNPDERGSAKGAIHRGIINARTAVNRDDDKAIVDEVLRGEDAALKGYQEALNEELPAETRQLVEQQRQEIQAAYEQVKSVDLQQEAKA